MRKRLLRHPSIIFVLFVFLVPGHIWGQSVSLTTLGSAYTQDFNTLISTPVSTTNTLTITGWHLTESGGGGRDNEQYGIDPGSSNSGDTYSYGAAGNSDRALGGVRSGTLIPIFGSSYTNNTGSTINTLQISYTGEQWRLGTAARTDQINFEYSTNATDLTSGTWTGVTALNFVSPATTTTGAKDGNDAANRTAKSGTITGLSIPAGATFWIRWTDVDANGADDGLAVDDFSLTPTFNSTPVLSINDVELIEGNSGTVNFNFTVSLSLPARPGGVTFDITTASNTAMSPADYTSQSLTGQTIAEGNSTYTFSVLINGDQVTESNETFFVTISNVTGADVTDGQGQGTITNDDVTITPIHDIQGVSHTSPIVGQSVSTTGIVTAVGNTGFYLQGTNPDADVATSEAIFVFTNALPTVSVGDGVQVTGTVTEFRPGGANSTNLTTTELISPSVTVLSQGNSLPVATILGTGGRSIPTTIIEDDANGNVETSHTFDPSTHGIDFYESLEGMLVQVNNPVAVSPTNDFGEIWVVADQGANASLRTARGGIVIKSTDFNPERIQIDDRLSGNRPTVNVGAQLSSITGVVDYEFGNYEVLPTTAPTVVNPSTLTKEITSLAGSASTLTVATFNVENLDPNDDASKFNNLAAAVVTNLKSPDVLVVEEIQDNNGATNNGTVDASTTFQTLISAIATAGGPTYQYRQIDPVNTQDGGEPGGNIRQGFLYNPDRVQFVDIAGGTSTGSTTVSSVGGVPQLSASPGRLDPTNTAFSASRKPLVGAFTFKGQTVFIIGNHFNSKGGDQPLFGVNQPPVLSSETQRNQQATVVKDFVQSILAINPNANVIVAGDLNDFEFSNPINTLKSAGLNVLIETLPENERYTYNFEGNAQAIDHIMVSNSLLGKLAGFDVVHTNSEFTDQISDHDPSVAQFTLVPPIQATLVASATAVCPASPVSLSLTVSGLSEGQTYSYTLTNGTNSTQASGISALSVETSLVPTVPGAFTATVLTSANASTTATSAMVTVKPSPIMPVFTANVPTSGSGLITVLQGTPSVMLSISGCVGSLNWTGTDNTSGITATISVPTSAVATLIYSATCTSGSCTSLPAAFTVTITAPLVAGSFDGFVNGADCGTFRGWAWDRNKVNTAVSVDILDGANVIGTLLAGDFRQDLLDAGKGNGKHAFRFTIPESIKDGLAHNLSARVAGSSFILKDSPKALVCQGTSTPSNKAPVPPSPTVLVAPLNAQVGVPFSGTLVAFTDPENQPLTYALSGLPEGISINMTSRVISGTPTQAGTFVLAYSASDGVLTNSVSFPLTVNPAQTTTVTGSFEGYLDKLDCGGIRGWVWDRNKPNTPLTVEFYVDGAGTVLGSTLANIYRQDLKDAGKGNGAHAYNFTPPGSVSSGTLIKARVLGSTYELKGGAKAYQCAPARLSAETGAGLQVTVFGNPVTDQVQVEVRGAEGQPLRLQLTDASGRLISLRQIEVAKPVEQQTLSVQQQPVGLLLLRVSSGSKSRTLKVVKQ